MNKGGPPNSNIFQTSHVTYNLKKIYHPPWRNFGKSKNCRVKFWLKWVFKALFSNFLCTFMNFGTSWKNLPKWKFGIFFLAFPKSPWKPVAATLHRTVSGKCLIGVWQMTQLFQLAWPQLETQLGQNSAWAKATTAFIFMSVCRSH